MVAKSGICHLCGANGKLSFEHVPPESAFNNRSIRTPGFQRVLALDSLDDLEKLGGKISQRGQGDYTLCEPCNNNTGTWYGSHYAAWCYQAAAYLVRSPNQLSLSYPFNFLPLRVIKQVVCMFFSVNSPHFRQAQPELVRFALDREAKYLPRPARVFVAYTASDRSRSAGVSGVVSGGTTRIYSEISFPPFSYIMDLNGQPPERPMLDISFFAHSSHTGFTTLHLPMPVLSVYTHLPGDFRTRDEAWADRRRNNDAVKASKIPKYRRAR